MPKGAINASGWKISTLLIARPVEYVQKRVQECDVYIGGIGMLYGSCPKGSKKSFTCHEYEAAVTKDTPRLIL
jgi:hypothetical protein